MLHVQARQSCRTSCAISARPRPRRPDAGGPAAAPGARARPTARAHKAVIFVYLFGGPSHIDTYDMKPDAPAEYRGEFKPIQTNVPGFDICELMPLQAKIADKLALVRNLTFNPNFHDPVELFSGFRKPTEAGARPGPTSARSSASCRSGERARAAAVRRPRQDRGRRVPQRPGLPGPGAQGVHRRPASWKAWRCRATSRSSASHDRTTLMQQFDTLRRDLDNRHGELAAHRRVHRPGAGHDHQPEGARGVRHQPRAGAASATSTAPTTPRGSCRRGGWWRPASRSSRSPSAAAAARRCGLQVQLGHARAQLQVPAPDAAATRPGDSRARSPTCTSAAWTRTWWC